MPEYSTREVAKKLGLSPSGLSKLLGLGKIPAPKMAKTGIFTVHLWTEDDIERARQLLPKIKNGRKTRYQKQKPQVGSQKSRHGEPSAGGRPTAEVRRQKSVKTKPTAKKQPQPRAAAPDEKKHSATSQ